MMINEIDLLHMVVLIGVSFVSDYVHEKILILNTDTSVSFRL